MNEVKTPKKTPLYYYGIVLLCLILFNSLVMPWFAQRQINLVDYGTFMTMTENKEIGLVEVQENQILFTNKDNTIIYKTGVMNDPTLVERLKNSGAQFSQQIVEEMSPLASFLIYWILPLVVFFGLGQLMNRRLMNKAGGNSMMFGLGKSNARRNPI